MNWIFWILSAIVFAIIELFTTSFFVIWFSVGSLVALFLNLLNVPLYGQIFSFLITSLLLLIYTRPLAKKYLEPKKNYKSNVDRLISSTGVVTKEVNSLNNNGQIKVKSEYWSATTYDDEIILEGSIVEIKEVKGVTLIVTKKNK